MNRLRLTIGLACLAAGLELVAPRPISAQIPTATIAGSVRRETGGPLVAAYVRGGGQETQVDSLGRFLLVGLRGDSVRVTVVRLGFQRLDTTVALHGKTPARLDLVLRENTWEAEMRKAQARTAVSDAAQGRVDSSASGLLLPDTVQSLTFGAFGARLLVAAVGRADPDSNTVLSPVSAGLALSLAALGARGTTAAALSGVLGTEALDRAALERRGAAFISATRGRRDVQLEIANAVWVDSAARLTSGFEASASALWASVGNLRLASPLAVESINRWADSVTHGKISRVLGGPLPDTTLLFIANAVYFKGKWLNPFERSATRPRDFTLSTGGRVRIPAMEMTERLAYEREPGYRMVRLPYRGGRVAMYVILPDSGGTVALERRFAERGWPGTLAAPHMQEVHLVLPKLHVQQAIDLKPLLLAQGAGVAFDCERADFRDLAVDPHSGTALQLCIGRAAQTIYLGVDEEGTEAAAVTGLAMVGTTSLPPPPVEFIVDRPFLFLLRDERSGANLFVGDIRHP